MEKHTQLCNVSTTDNSDTMIQSDEAKMSPVSTETVAFTLVRNCSRLFLQHIIAGFAGQSDLHLRREFGSCEGGAEILEEGLLGKDLSLV